VAEISGISVRSFYELFPDKEAAFVATLEELLTAAVAQVFDPDGWGEWTQHLDALVGRFEAQAPAARMCLLESYAAGPKAGELLEREIAWAEDLLSERLRESPERAAMPPEMAVAAVGAVLEVLRGHLMRRAGRLEDILPSLLSLLLGYRPPTRPLRSAARAPEVRPEAAEASDHAERAVRAFEALLTEQRYAEVTMEQVARRAQMSRRTLYANFSDRERLLAAAIDSACAQVLAVTLPAYQRHDIKIEGLRAAVGAFLALLASRPNLCHLLLIATYEGGEPALRRRVRGLRPLRSILQGVAARPPGSLLTAIELEAILGGILGLARRRLLQAGSTSLVSLAPICTYIVLAPLVGGERATTAAEGRAYRRGDPDLYTPVAYRFESSSALLAFRRNRARNASEVAREVGIPKAHAEGQIAELEAAGVLGRVAPNAPDDEPAYLPHWPLIPLGDWAEIDRRERESISTQLLRMIEVEVEEALETGSFEARPERHLVRMPMRLDEQGWREVSEQLDLTTERCLEIEKEARARLEAAGEAAEGLDVRIILVSFEAPPQEEVG
jgi:AcrR family transcriptional regulator